MRLSGIIRSGMMGVGLLGLALLAIRPCQAQPVDDEAFAALQADAKKTFRDQVTPFVRTYCVTCHGNRKSKAGVNFESALKYPGNAGFSKHWKQALTNVKT